MNQDNIFTIGTTHRICQDFSIGGIINNTDYYTVICDGCSSSPNSDFGARILSVGVKEELVRLNSVKKEEWDFNPKNCVDFAQPIIKKIGLPDESLDATVMVAAANKDGGYALNYGDGVIAIADIYDNIYIVSVEYTDSYPYYLNYLIDPKRLDSWENDHDKRKVTISILKNKMINIVDENMKVLGSMDFGDIHIRNERQRTYIFVNNLKKEIKYIAVLSDGIKSFYELINTETSKTNSPLDYHIILNELLSFKNFSGEFVQRRINRFIKDCQKKNWFNSDDLSLGVIYLGD